MRFATITSLFAAAALGLPADVENPIFGKVIDPASLNQGDGFYLSVPNKEGVAEVTFTPIAEFGNLKTRATEDLAHPAKLFERQSGVSCAGISSNLGNLDEANRQLARNAHATGHYNRGTRGWVRIDRELAFFCNYERASYTYDYVIGFHINVSNRCGQAGYGFQRRGDEWNSDVAVGRTFDGDRFCW